MTGLRILVLGAMLASTACSPTLNWRQVEPVGGGFSAFFPCRPDRIKRAVALATGESPVLMQMLVCETGDVTYAVSSFEVAASRGVNSTLTQLRVSAAANIGAVPSLPPRPMRVSGMTPNDQALRVALVGRLPNGSGVQEQVGVFAKGQRVYQASILGAKPSSEAVEFFFSNLKLSL